MGSMQPTSVDKGQRTSVMLLLSRNHVIYMNWRKLSAEQHMGLSGNLHIAHIDGLVRWNRPYLTRLAKAIHCVFIQSNIARFLNRTSTVYEHIRIFNQVSNRTYSDLVWAAWLGQEGNHMIFLVAWPQHPEVIRLQDEGLPIFRPSDGSSLQKIATAASNEKVYRKNPSTETWHTRKIIFTFEISFRQFDSTIYSGSQSGISIPGAPSWIHIWPFFFEACWGPQGMVEIPLHQEKWKTYQRP